MPRLPWTDELRALFGEPTDLRSLINSPRSRVWQVEIGGEPAVVKQIVGRPDADERFGRELTALRLAGPVGPAVLGADPVARVLVLEFIATRAPAGEWPVGYAIALARLHASLRPADRAALPAWQGPAEGAADAFLALAARLGAAAIPGVRGELRRACARLAATARPALLHGDPCPGNIMTTADGVRLIDLEQAAVGPAIIELAYLRIGFPTCWCVQAVPSATLDRAEAAYRETWCSATGADLDGDLADACVGWLVQGDALVRRAHRGRSDRLRAAARRDWTWGTATARERVLHRLDVVATMCAGHAELSGAAALTRTMHDRMRVRWPDLRAFRGTAPDPVLELP